MNRPSLDQLAISPSYVVGANGHPTAVVLDLAAWRAILAYLEDEEDNDILRRSSADLAALARGERPAEWKTWEEFEAELDETPETDELLA